MKKLPLLMLLLAATGLVGALLGDTLLWAVVNAILLGYWLGTLASEHPR